MSMGLSLIVHPANYIPLTGPGLMVSTYIMILDCIAGVNLTTSVIYLISFIEDVKLHPLF